MDEQPLAAPDRASGAAAWVRDGWFRAMFDASPVATALSDADGLLVAANPAYQALVGRGWEELAGRSAREYTHPDDVAQHRDLARLQAAADAVGEPLRVESRYLRPDGTQVWGWVSVSTVVGPDGTRATMAVVQDVTDRRRAESALRADARTDALTGLLNRRGWAARLADLPGDGAVPVSVAMIDLDRFKAYNDAHGHTAGDALLTRFALVLTTTLRGGDVVARWGGEEFVAALPGCATGDAAALLTLLADRMPAGVTFSAGLATARPGEPLTSTTARADRLLYRAKAGGRDRVETGPAPDRR